MPYTVGFQFVGHELLSYEMAWIVMRVFVPIGIPKLGHQLCRSIAEMERHGEIPCVPHERERLVYAIVGRVALRRCSQVDSSLCQWDTSLGPSYLHDSVKGGVGQQQCVRVGKADILACRYDKAAGDELRVLAALYHPCHPVKGCVRVRSTNRLDECGDDVVVHLTILVVGERVLLQTCCDNIVSDDDITILRRLYHKLQNIKKLPGVAS